MRELILDEAVPPRDFFLGDGLGACGAGEGIDSGTHGGRGEVEHALLGAEEVVGCAGGGVEAEEAAVGEPPGGGDGGEVGGSVRVEGGDEDDGRAEIEDCGGDGGVHGGWISGSRRTVWSLRRG